jgi:RHS repeat-associated protein
VWRYGYDGGNLVSTTDPAGRVTAFEHDVVGRVTRKTLPDGREVRFRYDANGNLAALTPPGRSEHAFGATATGRTGSYTAPALGSAAFETRYAYNTDGQVTRIDRPDGRAVSFGYDAGGRLESVGVPGGEVRYGYDAASGAMTSATAPDGGRLAFTFDGKLPLSTTWSGAVAGSVALTYDGDFRVVQQRVNGAHAVALQYDDDGLITLAGALTVGRDAATGRPVTSALGGTAKTTAYDSHGAVREASTRFGDIELFRAEYTRDRLGRITGLAEVVEGRPVTWGYVYDPAGRLESVTRDGAPHAAYEYDPNGNRVRTVSAGGVVPGSYDAQDRLLAYGDASYGYGAGGELAYRAVGADTTRYEYDVLGNLRSATLPGGTRIEYLVDAANRRIGKRVDGILRQGLLYGGRFTPVAELDGAGQVVSRFVYATHPHVPDYMEKDGRTYRLVHDHLGSVRLVVDAETGEVKQRLDYDPWGRVVHDSDPGFQPFGFAGGLYDADAGLVRFGARDYDPQTGRWTAKDPIGFAGGDTNLYGYVFADPVNLVDPSGRTPWDLLDAAFFAMSLADFLCNPSWENAGWLALDGLGLLPVLPSAGLLRRVGGMADEGGLILYKFDPMKAGDYGTGLRQGDYVMYLPDQGSEAANWAQNQARLLDEMSQGKPIRDIHPDRGGGFLDRERQLLRDNGWWRDERTGQWRPPSDNRPGGGAGAGAAAGAAECKCDK